MDQHRTQSRMKKALTAAMTLMTAGLALSRFPALPAAAGGTTYPLTVCGVPVTEDNMDDILGNGVFSYLPQSSLLIVCGDAEYDGTVIDTDASLTIDVQGDSILQSRCSDTIGCGNGTLMITGAGDLNLQAPEGCGIYLNHNTTLRICELLRMDITNAQYGIRGAVKDRDTKLNIEHSEVWISVSTAAIERINGKWKMPYCYFDEYAPVEIRHNDDGQYLVATDNNDEVSTYVHICTGTDQYEKYDLKIGDIPVSVVNRDDVLGNGVFNYDPDENVLEISGDHKVVNYISGAMITSGIKNLTVRTVKDSVLTAVNSRVLQTQNNMVITGGNALKMNAASDSMECIFVHGGSTLTIKEANLDLSGVKALAGSNQNSKLVIDGSYVHASGAIEGFSPISITGCEIIAPADARLNDDHSSIIEDSTGFCPDSVTIDLPTPKIGLHPQDTAAAVGETAQFGVAAIGGDLTYQWQYDSGKGWTNSTVASATTDTLKVSVTAAKNGFKYRCIITAAGGKTLISDAAALTVLTKITAQPKAASAYVGGTAAFTVTATGAGLKYQWQYNSGKGWTDSTLSTAKTATLSVTVTAPKNGFKYRCISTDANGKTQTSYTATLTVK